MKRDRQKLYTGIEFLWVETIEKKWMVSRGNERHFIVDSTFGRFVHSGF